MSRFIATDRSGHNGAWSILAAAILWGTVGVTTEGIYSFSATNPLSIGFFRLAIGALILLVVCWFLLGKRLWQIKRRDLLVMMSIGLLLALYQACYFAAITYCGVAVAALITLCVAPVLVALFSVTVGRERITITSVSAVVCAIGGTVLLVVARSNQQTQGIALIGVLLALGSAAGYAGIILAGGLIARRYHPLQINAVAFGTGAVLLLGLALATRFVVSYPVQGWLLLLYLGSVPTALAYGFFLLGIRSTSATVASVVTLCEPLTAAVLAWVFFREQLGVVGLLGGGCLIGAILLLTRSKELSLEQE